ncbi:hypothetical protein DL763_005324 [Monosporascus cannonballus]|nr:hypothetical protein DL763_005324 [Monosporascus cannonballus]
MSFSLPYHREDELFRTRSLLQKTLSQQDAAPAAAETSSSPGPQRRHLVFPDPVAFRYLEEDPCVSVVERREKLQGYELYLVEQWACSRQSPTLVIVTYTGDEKQSVVVGVLSVPADEDAWSPRLRVYFKAIQQYHARPKETPLGEVMVTNLSSFPSALTVIPVPDGDIKAHRKEFIVNEDLKRLGCSGRSGLTLTEPTGASKSKFYLLYKTSEKIPFPDAVLELVKLCQVALYIFGKLERVYIDGLLCDVTETAVGDWWTEFGAEYYNVEPADGILGPTTVVALLGLLMGARNRLSYLGAPVSKDVFDLESTERGIYYFQKYIKVERSQRTRRLDRQTLYKLHAATAKAASGEGWGVQKAVKSTVREIGGERGELVLGMVGGRDKGGIGDIETLDLDKFIRLLSGERAKWLWLGKPKRPTADYNERSIPDMSNIFFGKEETNAQAKRAQQASQDEGSEASRREDSHPIYSSPAPASTLSIGDSPGEKDAHRRGVFKNVARDARSGFERIKGAVYNGGGPRGQTARASRDTSSDTPFPGTATPISSHTSGGLDAGSAAPLGRAFTWKNKPEEYAMGIRKESGSGSTPPQAYDRTRNTQPTTKAGVMGQNDTSEDMVEMRNEVAAIESSVAESVAIGENDLYGPVLLAMAERHFNSTITALHRRHSIHTSQRRGTYLPNESRWPRRMSFSEAEEAVLRWEELAVLENGGDENLEADVEEQARLAEVASSLYQSIFNIKQGIEPWVDQKIQSIEEMSRYYSRQQEELQAMYYERSDACQEAKQQSQEIIAEERNRFNELLREIETWGQKLDYEISGLESRVQDVESGVDEFEVRVGEVEEQADELKVQLETESWLHWAVRTLTGIGTGPNITRG